MSCANDKELARLVSGIVEPEPAAALKEHLGRCARCRDRHAHMAAMTGRLAADPGEFDQGNLVADVMSGIRQAESKRRLPAPARASWRWLWAPVVAACATVAILVARPALRPAATDGFQARGGAVESPDRWVSVQIFRATDTGYQRVVDRVAADDALAFAYSNPGDEGYRYLMIVAVDERGEVFWYYPAGESDERNPHGVGIARTSRADLPDEIRQALRPGALRIFAVFSKEPYPVGDIDRVLRKDLQAAQTLARLDRLSLAGTGQQTFLLAVGPPADAGRRSGPK
jgi:hypothetical protein